MYSHAWSHLAPLIRFFKFPPQGMKGGGSGATGIVELNGKKIHPKKIHTIQPGDILTLGTPGGAGFWSPQKRDREKIHHDLKNELISARQAKTVYACEG